MAIRTSAAEVDLCSSLVFPAIQSISPRTNDKESTQDITIAVHSRGVCPEDMKMITIIKSLWLKMITLLIIAMSKNDYFCGSFFIREYFFVL